MQRSAVVVTLLSTIVLTLAGCGGRVEDTRPGQPVKHRQEAFKALLRAFEPVGLMLHDGAFDAERLAKLNEALAAARDVPFGYFAPDTDYPPSKSRPEVWSQPEKWQAARQRFVAATDALKAAGDADAAQKAYDEARASCKACHDAFRQR
ncbi:MAG: cytochrome c [Azoarcus sp.]|jgi:cytochrome c556|nr:cytochrome c [Azoarcus sp.]